MCGHYERRICFRHRTFAEYFYAKPAQQTVVARLLFSRDHWAAGFSAAVTQMPSSGIGKLIRNFPPCFRSEAGRRSKTAISDFRFQI